MAAKQKIIEAIVERAKAGESLAMDYISRMSRAKEQGFDVDSPVYHGTDQEFSAFDPSAQGSYSSADTAGVVTLTPDAGIARDYSLGEAKLTGGRYMKSVDDDEIGSYMEEVNPRVIEAIIKGDIKKINAEGMNHNAKFMMKEQKQAREEGYDGIQFVGMMDGTFYNPMGNSTDTIQIFDPANIRSINAAFDPARSKSSDLLAGLGALGIGVGAMGASEESQAGGLSAVAKELAKRAESGDVAATSFINAWHGSPHDFDKFSMGSIGTGEGAQAYGHGLYFAGDRKVAEGYRENLAGQTMMDRNKVTDLFDPEQSVAASISRRMKKDGVDPSTAKALEIKDWEDRKEFVIKEAENYIEEGAGEWGDLAKDVSDEMAIYDKSIKGLSEFDESRVSLNEGRLFNVNIDATPDELLDWDKPLSEQSEQVQASLRTYIDSFDDKEKVRRILGDNPTGEDVYELSEMLTSKTMFNSGEAAPVTSSKLSDMGIKGIQYDDALSRGNWKVTPPDETVAGDWMVKDASSPQSKGMHFKTESEAQAAITKQVGNQTKNYVIFSDELIDIAKKYGVALPVAAGMMAQTPDTQAALLPPVNMPDDRIEAPESGVMQGLSQFLGSVEDPSSPAFGSPYESTSNVLDRWSYGQSADKSDLFFAPMEFLDPSNLPALFGASVKKLTR